MGSIVSCHCEEVRRGNLRRDAQSVERMYICSADCRATLFAMAGISDRASGGSHEEGIDESANIRLEAWKAAVSMAIHNPFSGVGLNNYYYNFYFYSDFWDSKNHAVHSTWFGVMAETGFVGFILFILLLHALYRSILYTIRRCSLPDITKAYGSYIPAMSEALLAGAASFLTSGTFLTQGFTWPLYIILALTVSLRHLIEKQEL